MIDLWWRRQFERLLACEKAGDDPKRLTRRWLVLASLTWGDRRRKLSFVVPPDIYRVLDDPDVRSKDRRYAERQWQIAEKWLNA